MIQYYYTKKEWGVVMEKEELKILEELRRILNSKNEAIVILNNYFKGGVGKSKLSTMFAYLTDKFNLKVLMIDKDLQATLTKDLIFSFSIMDNHLFSIVAIIVYKTSRCYKQRILTFNLLILICSSKQPTIHLSKKGGVFINCFVSNQLFVTGNLSLYIFL